MSTWEHSWDVVRTADHPALGLCLDSFHVLSRGGDPAGFAAVPGDKLFFLQLADAPQLAMDVLQWSRHHRLFPGQGAFDLPAFLGAVLGAGYTGPLSLEVFNDVFRQADPARTAVDAMRSLLALEAALPTDPRPLPPAPVLTGHAFTELAVDGVSGPVVADALGRLGFAHTGQHRSKPVQLWEQGTARVLLNAGATRPADGEAAVVAVAVESVDPAGSAARAEALLAPVLPRSRGDAEAELSAVGAPDGTQVFFARTGPDGWPADFLATGATAAGAGLTHTDHVGLTQPFDAYDEAALFYDAVLGLRPGGGAEVAAPFGLVRSRGVATPDRAVRLALSVSLLRRGGGWTPGVPDPQHIAFATDDVVATAGAMRAAGAPLLAVPANYHADLDARLELDPALLADLREHGLLYDADAHGAFLHLYTEVLGGRVFFEVVQRLGGYDGYGAVNSPVRMAAHRRARQDARAGTPAPSG